MERFIRTPFAQDGDRIPVPDTVQPTGDVSYPQGWTVDYQLDQDTNPLAKDVSRESTNSLMYDLSVGLREFQTTGFPDWILPAQNGGVAFAYPVNAVVRYDPGTGVRIYRNNVEGNINVPTGAGWSEWQVSGGGGGGGGGLSDTIPIVNGIGAAGTSNLASRGDHVHPTDLSRAPINSPNFLGIPTAPTAAPGTATTQIASTEFVANAVAGGVGGGPAVASQAQAQAWLDNATFISPLRLDQAAQGANQQRVAAGGYQKFPGGLILQWGSVTVNVTSVNTWVRATATFPISFPTACFGVVSSEATTAVGTVTPANNQGPDTVGIDAITASTFRQWAYDYNQTGSTVFNYLAWGF